MKRVLLKLSGEALAGNKKTGFDEPTVMGVARQVRQLCDLGMEIGVVIGGGNFWRGRSSRAYRPDESRPDRHACYRYELYLCVGDFSLGRDWDGCDDAVFLRSFYGAVFQGPGHGVF